MRGIVNRWHKAVRGRSLRGGARCLLHGRLRMDWAGKEEQDRCSQGEASHGPGVSIDRRFRLVGTQLVSGAADEGT
jgi:hypothetical protein